MPGRKAEAKAQHAELHRYSWFRADSSLLLQGDVVELLSTAAPGPLQHTWLRLCRMPIPSCPVPSRPLWVCCRWENVVLAKRIAQRGRCPQQASSRADAGTHSQRPAAAWLPGQGFPPALLTVAFWGGSSPGRESSSAEAGRSMARTLLTHTSPWPSPSCTHRAASRQHRRSLVRVPASWNKRGRRGNAGHTSGNCQLGA